MSSAKQDRTKVVVRNLPPTLTEESFKAAVDKVAEGCYDWIAYYPGKVSLKRTLHSRGYLHLLSPEHVLAFKERFDGHVFVSSKGSQYRCSVEYAPFQRVPKPPAKKPAMEGTIESDPDYQAFLKKLDEGPASLPSATAQLEAREAEGRAALAADGSEGGKKLKPVVVTPLMEFLQKKYAGGALLRRGGAKGRARAVQRLDVVEEAAESKGKKGRSAKAAAADYQQGGAAAQAAAAAALSAPTAKQADGGKGAKEHKQLRKEPKQRQQNQRQQQGNAATSSPASTTQGAKEAGASSAKKGGKSDASKAAAEGPVPAARAPKQSAASQPARQSAAAQAADAKAGNSKARPTSTAGQDKGSGSPAGGKVRPTSAAPASPATGAAPVAQAATARAPTAQATTTQAATAQAASAQGASAASSSDAGADGAARRPRGLVAGGARNRLFASALQKAAGAGASGSRVAGKQQAGSATGEKTGQG